MRDGLEAYVVLLEDTEEIAETLGFDQYSAVWVGTLDGLKEHVNKNIDDASGEGGGFEVYKLTRVGTLQVVPRKVIFNFIPEKD